jgi:hypothetical protein
MNPSPVGTFHVEACDGVCSRGARDALVGKRAGVQEFGKRCGIVIRRRTNLE